MSEGRSLQLGEFGHGARGIIRLMKEEVIQARIQLMTHAAALVAVILYAAGFLTLSLHHAYFGVAQFGLLRPKILSAGILLLVFFALPVLEVARVYGLWKFGDPRLQNADDKQVEPHDRLNFLHLSRLVALLTSAMAISIAIRPFLVNYDPDKKLLVWSLVMVAGFVLALVGVRILGKKHPLTCRLLRVSSILLFPLGLWRMNDLKLVGLVVWFCWSAWIGHEVSGAFKNLENLRNSHWHIVVLNAVGTVSLFTLLIYPNVRPAFGGGAPTPATFYFSAKNPIGDAGQAQIWLLDETDAGYYILNSKEAKKAVFIPRGAVSAIYFGEPSPATHVGGK